MGAKVALTGLTLPERGRPPADVGRGGLPADTGRDGLGLHGSTVMYTPTRSASYDYLNVPMIAARPSSGPWQLLARGESCILTLALHHTARSYLICLTGASTLK